MNFQKSSGDKKMLIKEANSLEDLDSEEPNEKSGSKQ